MSQKEYIKALNKEIQKLNGIIDNKIMQHMDYSKEARRHKLLLQQIRREERRRCMRNFFNLNLFSKV